MNSRNQSIEELAKTFNTLREEQIRTDTKLKTAQDLLKQSKSEAKSEWGTDKIDELKDLLKTQNKENEKTRAAYQIHLENIQTQLNSIENAGEAKEIDDDKRPS